MLSFRFSVLLVVLLAWVVVSQRAARAQSAPIALGVYFWDRGLCAPGDQAAVESWRAKIGRMPAAWSIYQSWTGWNQFPAQQAQRARALGGWLMVTWEPWNGRDDDANWSCAAIAGGTYDAYIRQYARAVRESGAPVMMRLGHEMNGDWYPWATAYSGEFERHNGNEPESYVAMWRHVVDLFREEGALNAKWAWSPNVFFINGFNSAQRQTRDLQALYPGDSYVDWVGVSVYNDGAHAPWRSFSQLFDGAYQVLSQISDKPMMVAELGVTEEGAPRGTSKAQWLASALLDEIPRRYPDVRLVNYFFRDKRDQGQSNFRFDSSPDALNAFRQAAASPLYRGYIVSAMRPVSTTSQFPVRVVAPAQMRPRDPAPATVMTGNNGVFRNGERSALAPRLQVAR